MALRRRWQREASGSSSSSSEPLYRALEFLLVVVGVMGGYRKKEKSRERERK